MSIDSSRSNIKNKKKSSNTERFLGFAFAAADILMEIDHNGIIQYCAGATENIIGIKTDDMAGKSANYLVVGDDKEVFDSVLAKMQPGIRCKPMLISISTKNGKKDMLISGFKMPTPTASISYLTFSEAKNLPQTRAEKIDRHVETGMLSKDEFIDQAKRVTSSNETQEEQLSFLVIKGLENIRETKGEEGVNDFLKKLANGLRASSLGGDSIGLLEDGRIGILHEAGGYDADIINKHASKMAAKISEETGDEVSVESFSIDLQVPGMSDEDAARAVAYTVQKFSEHDSGSFKVSTLNESAVGLLEDTLTRINKLRETMAARQFEVAVQPIYSLKTGKISHFEALTRFEGNKSPAQLIEFAERVGMIEDFDLLMTQKVLEILKKHHSIGWKPCVAVNISARSLRSDVFVKQLIKVISPYGLVKDQLHFEITETAAIEDYQRLNKIIMKLKENGHQIYLDDFGTGSTSYETLYELSVDKVKIDGQFVRNALKKSRDFEMLKSMVNLCKSLGHAVVAEQIDDQSQVTMLKKLGVDYGQGYLFGRPETTFSAEKYRANSNQSQDLKTQWG